MVKNLKNNTSTFYFSYAVLTAHSADGDTCPSKKDEFLPISDPLEDSISINPELSANLGKGPKEEKEPLEEQEKEPLEEQKKEPLEEQKVISNKEILDLAEKESIDVADKEIVEEVIKRKNKLNQFFLDMKILDFIKSVFLKEKNLSFLGFVTGLMVIFCFFMLIIFRILFKGS
jgi:hypothetical protein